eukprot:GILJ01005595.1.p1 GENE.GILJ01005595.1~~GILJ01005595.1.p1  ORF type:complete len:240 (+),score=14.76 GILJ01005595.1:35-754(+)
MITFLSLSVCALLFLFHFCHCKTIDGGSVNMTKIIKVSNVSVDDCLFHSVTLVPQTGVAVKIAGTSAGIVKMSLGLSPVAELQPTCVFGMEKTLQADGLYLWDHCSGEDDGSLALEGGKHILYVDFIECIEPCSLQFTLTVVDDGILPLENARQGCAEKRYLGFSFTIFLVVLCSGACGALCLAGCMYWCLCRRGKVTYLFDTESYYYQSVPEGPKLPAKAPVVSGSEYTRLKSHSSVV